MRHTSPLPRAAAGGPVAVSVFLDPTRNQREAARACLLAEPAVASVRVSGFTPWVMFVTFAPVGLSSSAWR
ncbi:hypothetical protein Kisp01_64010 [Kineosporia sp. NBRC 101677]|nr:hypothetical protein Kisp01_64010 [Kineosporia sp. NBRC 101677]